MSPAHMRTRRGTVGRSASPAPSAQPAAKKVRRQVAFEDAKEQPADKSATDSSKPLAEVAQNIPLEVRAVPFSSTWADLCRRSWKQRDSRRNSSPLGPSSASQALRVLDVSSSIAEVQAVLDPSRGAQVLSELDQISLTSARITEKPSSLARQRRWFATTCLLSKLSDILGAGASAGRSGAALQVSPLAGGDFATLPLEQCCCAHGQARCTVGARRVAGHLPLKISLGPQALHVC